MGLFNRFKKSKNYAQEYKTAVENNDLVKMTTVIANWLENGPKDANFGLAMVILTCIRADVPISETVEIYELSIKQKPDDSSLFDWYDNTACELMKKRADDIADNDDELSVMFKAKQSTPDDDNGYAKEFLRLYKISTEGDDPLEMVNALNEMLEIHKEWSEKFPDDANMLCAFVVMKIGYLDDDEIDSLMKKADSLKPIDVSSYPELLSAVEKLKKMK